MNNVQNAFRNTLQDLRLLMLQRTAILMLVVSLFIAYTENYEKPLIWHPLLFNLLIALAMFLVYRWSQLRLNFPRYTFVFILHLQLMGAMLLYPLPSIPFFGVLVVILSALLTSNSTFFSAPIIFTWTYILNTVGLVDYPIGELFGLLAISSILAYTTAETFYTALTWYSSMFEHAENLLKETRERRAELVQALKSLEISYNTQERMKHQLVQAQHSAMEARQLKEQFAANISHELRTPLNLILGFSEILYLTPEVYGNVSLPPRLVRDIYQIYRSSRHLQNLIDDVLDLSHIELSGFGLTFSQTDMNQFMAETVDMLEGMFHNKTIDLILDIPINLPTIDIDRTRLRQAIINLISNAQRFTSEGSVSLTVQRINNQLVFTVADTGIGIPEEYMATIFDEFFQVDYSLSRSHGGAGLGLAITRKFVEAHGGTIRVESQPNIGSSFCFTLPIQTKPTTTSRNDIQSDSRATDSAILMVEKDISIIKLVQRHLPDYEIIQVQAIENVVEMVQTYHPSAVIANLPPASVGDNLQILNTLPIPTIQCTLPSSQWLIEKLNIHGYLPKPINPQQIYEVLYQYPKISSILIVDDEVGLVQFIQRALEVKMNDLKIYRAYDGQQAIDITNDNTIDLILLDSMMPDMDGSQVIRILHTQSHTQNIPIVLMTAAREVHDEREQRSEMIIRQIDGLDSVEVLRCLRPIIDNLQPRYTF